MLAAGLLPAATGRVAVVVRHVAAADLSMPAGAAGAAPVMPERLRHSLSRGRVSRCWPAGAAARPAYLAPVQLSCASDQQHWPSSKAASTQETSSLSSSQALPAYLAPGALVPVLYAA